MTRKEGFIEVDKMLEEIGIDTFDIGSILSSPKVKEIDYIPFSKLHFSFTYHNETYYFKRNIYQNCSPYNELVAEELAKDFDIPCIEYDLAILGKIHKGVLSKDFKKTNVNYVSGEDILEIFIDYYDSDLVRHSRCTKNTLDDIWDKLEKYYQCYLNRETIITNLMNQIVNIYLFDIITCQNDRHEQNWQIMESEEEINVTPIYDNERILMCYSDEANVYLGIDITDYEDLWDSIKKFQKVSSEEFTNIIKEKLWIISEENLNKVFERIEAKTGYPMPKERKDFYINSYREHKKRLEETLDLTVEREDYNERKNR